MVKREYHLLGWKKRKTIKERNPRKLAEVLPTEEASRGVTNQRERRKSDGSWLLSLDAKLW